MRAKIKGTCIAVVVMLSGCAAHVMTAAEKQEGTTAITTTLDAQVQTWLMRDVKPMADTMAPDEDAVNVGTDENEIIAGKRIFVEGMQRALAGFDKVSKASISNRRIFFSRDGCTAWTFAKWDIDAVAAGKPFAVKGMRVTTVLEKRDGKWLAVHTHASMGLPPQPAGNVGPQ